MRKYLLILFISFSCFSQSGLIARQNYSTKKIVYDARLVLYNDVSLLASYPGTGTLLTDLSISNNNGTLINGVGFNSLNGGSLVFDGIDDYVTMASVPTGNNFTVNVWVNVSAFGVRNAVVNNAFTTGNLRGWLFALGGGGTNSFYLTIGADQAYSVSVNNVLSLNQWCLISASVSNGGQNIKLYKNGVIVNSQATSFANLNIDYSTNFARLGRRDITGNTDLFSGKIAFLKVFKVVLSDTEILQIFNETKSKFGL